MTRRSESAAIRLDAPIPTGVVLMISDIVTILAVGGFVKSAIAPAAAGKPCP